MRTLLAHGGPASERRAWPGEEAPAALDELLARYDFSRAYAHLVPTAPGHHVGAERFKWGHPLVRRLLERDGACFPRRCAGAGASTVFMQFSSFAASPDGLFEQYAQSFGAGACCPASAADAGREPDGAGAGAGSGPMAAAAPPQLGAPTIVTSSAGRPCAGSDMALGALAGRRSVAARVRRSSAASSLRAWADGGARRRIVRERAAARARARAMPHNKCYGRASDGSRELAWFLLRAGSAASFARGLALTPLASIARAAALPASRARRGDGFRSRTAVRSIRTAPCSLVFTGSSACSSRRAHSRAAT